MAKPGKHYDDGPETPAPAKSPGRDADLSQLDFEMEFFGGILQRAPDYVDALRVFGSLLSLKGRFADGLKIDRKLVKLRPEDPLAHYNLACSYALLQRSEQSLKILRRAVELGYRDFRFMREDHDLDSIKHDPRFRQILHEYENG